MYIHELQRWSLLNGRLGLRMAVWPHSVTAGLDCDIGCMPAL